MLYLYLEKRRLSQNDDSLKRPTKTLLELSQRSTIAFSYLSQTGMCHPTGYGITILSLNRYTTPLPLFSVLNRVVYLYHLSVALKALNRM